MSDGVFELFRAMGQSGVSTVFARRLGIESGTSVRQLRHHFVAISPKLCPFCTCAVVLFFFFFF